MTESTDDAVVIASHYWRPLLGRAVLMVIAAVVVTFSADHSLGFGLIVFGVTALLAGALMVYASREVTERLSRQLVLKIALADVAGGIVGVVLFVVGSPNLIILMIIWAAVTGIIELYAGLRVRSRTPVSREWVAAGGITALFALALLLVPADFTQTYVIERSGVRVAHVLDAAIVTVGLFGAYCAVIGVYLVIAAISLRPARAIQEVTA